MSKRQALLAIAVLAIMKTDGSSQEIGQAGRGFALAQRLCAQCHAVQKDEAASPNPDAPLFPTIASVPGMTAIALRRRSAPRTARCPISCSSLPNRPTS
jgi:mono/diheme cytochrome c family protein